MKHSAMNRRLLLEWLCDCDDVGEPMPSDAQIRDRFRFTSEEQARGLLTDLAEAKLVVVTGVGRSRSIALPGAKPIRPTLLTRDDRDRLPATIKRVDPGVERVAALISSLKRQAADKKEPTMPKQPNKTPVAALHDLLRDAGGSFDALVARLLDRVAAAEAASGQRAEDAATIAALTARAEAAEGKLATLRAALAA